MNAAPISTKELHYLRDMHIRLSRRGYAVDAKPEEWITVNGARIPLDNDGEPTGKVGEKLKASGGDPIYAAKELGEKSKAGTLTAKDDAVVVSAPSLDNTPLHELTKGPQRAEIKKTITGDLENHITGEKINLSGNKADHLISSALNRGEGGLPHMAAVQNVHSIMAGAIPTASTRDEKKQQDVKSVQRFYGAMEYDGGMYRVTMLVKGYSGERNLELEGVKKLYDMKLDKKIPDSGNGAPNGRGHGMSPRSGTSALTIERLLDGVKEKPILSRKGAAEDQALFSVKHDPVADVLAWLARRRA